MGLTFVGSLPVSALNIGLAAGVGALGAQITYLGVDVTNFGIAAAKGVGEFFGRFGDH